MLRGRGVPSGTWVGVELTAKDKNSTNDGVAPDKRRKFRCDPGRALFLPASKFHPLILVGARRSGGKPYISGRRPARTRPASRQTPSERRSRRTVADPASSTSIYSPISQSRGSPKSPAAMASLESRLADLADAQIPSAAASSTASHEAPREDYHPSPSASSHILSPSSAGSTLVEAMEMQRDPEARAMQRRQDSEQARRASARLDEALQGTTGQGTTQSRDSGASVGGAAWNDDALAGASVGGAAWNDDALPGAGSGAPEEAIGTEGASGSRAAAAGGAAASNGSDGRQVYSAQMEPYDNSSMGGETRVRYGGALAGSTRSTRQNQLRVALGSNGPIDDEHESLPPTARRAGRRPEGRSEALPIDAQHGPPSPTDRLRDTVPSGRESPKEFTQLPLPRGRQRTSGDNGHQHGHESTGEHGRRVSSPGVLEGSRAPAHLDVLGHVPRRGSTGFEGLRAPALPEQVLQPSSTRSSLSRIAQSMGKSVEAGSNAGYTGARVSASVAPGHSDAAVAGTAGLRISGPHTPPERNEDLAAIQGLSQSARNASPVAEAAAAAFRAVATAQQQLSTVVPASPYRSVALSVDDEDGDQSPQEVVRRARRAGQMAVAAAVSQVRELEATLLLQAESAGMATARAAAAAARAASSRSSRVAPGAHLSPPASPEQENRTPGAAGLPSTGVVQPYPPGRAAAAERAAAARADMPSALAGLAQGTSRGSTASGADWEDDLDQAAQRALQSVREWMDMQLLAHGPLDADEVPQQAEVANGSRRSQIASNDSGASPSKSRRADEGTTARGIANDRPNGEIVAEGAASYKKDEDPPAMLTPLLDAAQHQADLITKNMSVEQASELAKLAGEHSKSLRALLEAEIENGYLRQAVETMHRANEKLLRSRRQQGRLVSSPSKAGQSSVAKALGALDASGLAGASAAAASPGSAQLTDELARVERIREMVRQHEEQARQLEDGADGSSTSKTNKLNEEALAAAKEALLVADRLAALTTENHELRRQQREALQSASFRPTSLREPPAPGASGAPSGAAAGNATPGSDKAAAAMQLLAHLRSKAANRGQGAEFERPIDDERDQSQAGMVLNGSAAAVPSRLAPTRGGALAAAVPPPGTATGPRGFTGAAAAPATAEIQAAEQTGRQHMRMPSVATLQRAVQEVASSPPSQGQSPAYALRGILEHAAAQREYQQQQQVDVQVRLPQSGYGSGGAGGTASLSPHQSGVPRVLGPKEPLLQRGTRIRTSSMHRPGAPSSLAGTVSMDLPAGLLARLAPKSSPGSKYVSVPSRVDTGLKTTPNRGISNRNTPTRQEQLLQPVSIHASPARSVPVQAPELGTASRHYGWSPLSARLSASPPAGREANSAMPGSTLSSPGAHRGGYGRKHRSRTPKRYYHIGAKVDTGLHASPQADSQHRSYAGQDSALGHGSAQPEAASPEGRGIGITSGSSSSASGVSTLSRSFLPTGMQARSPLTKYLYGQQGDAAHPVAGNARAATASQVDPPRPVRSKYAGRGVQSPGVARSPAPRIMKQDLGISADPPQPAHT